MVRISASGSPPHDAAAMNAADSSFSAWQACYDACVDCQHDVAAPRRRCARRRDGDVEEARVTGPAGLGFGVNLNNREPLIAPGYGMPELLDLSQSVEELGFDSVWVGDSLFSKPRYESMALLSALSQRTQHVKLGTACLVTSPRNPLYLALEWATLDVLSGGRTIFGACAGNPEEGVRREFEALGLDFDKRFAIFEEGLEIVRQLWTTGTVTHHGAQYDYDGHQLLLGHRDGAADAHPAAAAVLDRVQPAPRDRRVRREDGAHDEDRLSPHPAGTARAG